MSDQSIRTTFLVVFGLIVISWLAILFGPAHV